MKHNWEVVDAGEYDSIHQCTRCKRRVMVSVDNPSSNPPEGGCIPSTKEIAAEVKRLEKQIVKLQREVCTLQTICTHPNLKKKHGSNTGNYDPSCDCYWTEFDCPDCGRRWTEDGSK